MEFSELKIDTFIENKDGKLQVKYHCVCDDPENPKFTLLNESEELVFKNLQEIKEEEYVKCS